MIIPMKNTIWSFLILLLFSGCANLTRINDLPNIALGEASFYPTIAAHTDASIVAGNRVELLFNGDQIFPAMLKAIRSARKSITYQQYLFEDGAIAHEIAEAFAEYETIENLKICLLRAEVANPDLPRELEALGAIVDDIALYKTMPETEDRGGGAERLKETGADWVLFTSASTVENSRSIGR
jgi:hypothetical protein